MGILVIVLSHLLGAIPFGYLIPRWTEGVDIRSLGTGNPGTANVFRTVGLGAAIPVGVLDIGKGVAPVLLARAAGLSEGWALAAGVVGDARDPVGGRDAREANQGNEIRALDPR